MVCQRIETWAGATLVATLEIGRLEFMFPCDYSYSVTTMSHLIIFPLHVPSMGDIIESTRNRFSRSCAPGDSALAYGHLLCKP